MLEVGDVVRHRVLGSEKIVVGVSRDRYLCVYQGDVGEDGRLQPNARVAMHRGESLRKVGRLDTILPVNLEELYGQEYKQTTRLRRRNLFREEIVPYTLFLVATLLIILAVFSGVDKARPHIEAAFFKKAVGQHLEQEAVAP